MLCLGLYKKKNPLQSEFAEETNGTSSELSMGVIKQSWTVVNG